MLQCRCSLDADDDVALPAFGFVVTSKSSNCSPSAPLPSLSPWQTGEAGRRTRLACARAQKQITVQEHVLISSNLKRDAIFGLLRRPNTLRIRKTYTYYAPYSSASHATTKPRRKKRTRKRTKGWQLKMEGEGMVGVDWGVAASCNFICLHI